MDKVAQDILMIETCAVYYLKTTWNWTNQTWGCEKAHSIIYNIYTYMYYYTTISIL